jgi:predicted secreted protein
MTAIAGYAGNIKLGSSGGTNAVAEIKSWEIPLAADMYDVSAMGSQWKAYLPGLTGASAKADVFLDPTDTTGQIALQNALLGGTSVTANFYVTSSHYYSATAFIKQMDIKAPVNNAIEASLDLQLSGAISYT